MTKQLSKRAQRNRFTPEVRMVLSCGIDFFGEFDYLPPDRAAIEAEIKQLYKNSAGFTNHDLIQDLERKITSNFWFANLEPGVDPRIDFLRGQWKAHKDEVLKHHVAKFPGTRPFGFWAFDYPDERPPHISSSSQEGGLAELKFLIRHDLLSAEEIAAIRAADDSRTEALAASSGETIDDEPEVR